MSMRVLKHLALGLLALGGAVAACTAMAAAPAAQSTGPQREGVPGGRASLAGVSSAADVEVGRRIYLQGLGANGAPITGLRMGGIESTGAAVACARCHRSSGLGAVEGTEQVPPIAGRFLLEDEPQAVVSLNYRNVKSFNQRHAPYDLATLTAALNHGKHATGRELGLLMPRYEFNDAEVRGLAAYLRTLSATWSPGVTAQRVRLATVITPEVSAERRQLFIGMSRAAVSGHNGTVVPGGRSMNAAEMLLGTQRYWDLEVWQLEGPPETWAAQLDARQQARPAFALVSGLGEGTWAPVHEFCERRQVPCWFPSVPAAPAQAGRDFYSLYFSRGVTLEADVLAHHWLRTPAERPRRVLQLHAGDAAGLAGAQQLQAAAAQARLPRGMSLGVDTHALDLTSPAGLAQARTLLAGLSAGDAVMAWLAPADAARLAALPLPAQVASYWSGTQVQREGLSLPLPWRDTARVIYPYQLPDKRQAGLFYFKSWLTVRQLPLREELMQSEVYFAWSYLAETLSDMLDNLHGDYLLERAENMLSLREAAKAEDEARESLIARHQSRGGTQAALARLKLQSAFERMPRPLPGRTEQATGKRESTTVYPRLGLAPGQRFASKGAYLVRLGAPEGPALEAVSTWIVP